MQRTVPVLAVFLLTAIAFAGCTSPDGTSSTNHAPVTTTNSAGQTVTTTPMDTNPWAAPSSNTQVAGSGATFPKPLLETWGIEFARLHSTVQVSYGGGGSGKGITDITNKDVVFGASDAPLSASEKAKAAGILQFPDTLGVIGVVYNVAGLGDGLKLDGPTVGKIFLGQIRKWNDAAIQQLNSGMTLPDKNIAIVYRSDSSGTTFAYTDWMARTSSDWMSTMGAANKKPDWTKSTATQLSGAGNDGVGSQVRANDGTIGYVELAYVKSLNLKSGAIKNQAGEFLQPTTDGGKKAAVAAAPVLPAPDGDWSAVSISNADGTGVYPISTFSYVMVYDGLARYNGKISATQLTAFKSWMWWGIHDGQAYSEALGYAPLPAEVVKIGENALKSIQG